MNIRYISAIAMACALAACQSTHNQNNSMPSPSANQTAPAAHDHDHNHHHGNHDHAHSHGETMPAQTFECKNGMTATVQQFGNDTASLRVNTVGAEVKLMRVVSGSGQRFVSNSGFYNQPTEWHAKGKMGYLSFKDPYGNVVETVCNAK